VTQEVNEVFVCESKSRIFGGIYDNKGCAAFLERHLDVAKVLRDKKITDLCRVKKVVMVTPRKGYTDVKGIYLAFENVLTPGFMCPPDYTKYIEYRAAESLSETSESKEKNDKNGINDSIPRLEKVFFDLRQSVITDEILDKIMRCPAEYVAVCVTDDPKNNRAIRNLEFEQDYLVLTLEAEKTENLVKCAKDYCRRCKYKSNKVDFEKLVNDMQSLRGGKLTENELCIHLGRCMRDKSTVSEDRILTDEDVAVSYYRFGRDHKTGHRRFVGREDVKRNIERMAYARKLMEDSEIIPGCHMIFSGTPGTGKTQMARLFGDFLTDLGLSNGRFVEASRADLIGRYVGQTAPKVEKLFKDANGGVLFVDEAGFLLQNDSYVHDAVTEFVRFMENCPETTVIFATYPEEAEKLRHVDPGFASRIKRVIRFESYTDKELQDIMASMAEDYGFRLEAGYEEGFISYIREARNKKGFGNGRTVRKLLETAIEEAGMRCKGQKTCVITASDVSNAAKLLSDEEAYKKEYGFCTIDR
jgi:AAA+ superfamily predicted ATPase